MKIDNLQIGLEQRPYIIAEISANHNGSIDTAKKLIQLAQVNGASAVKLQTYTSDTITLDSDSPDFQIKTGLWQGRTLYELYEQAHTPWEWHAELFAHAQQLGITIFSSPFDKTAVDLLESLETPAYKIASFEIVDHDLISYVGSTGKPLIISTGMASKDEIEEALQVATQSGARDIALLHCLSAYPAPASQYKLNTIGHMRRDFGCEIGLSDHSLGNELAIASIALGASLVEKHFTLDSSGSGPDDSFSMDPEQLSRLRASLDLVHDSLGFDNYAIQDAEVESIQFRRSLYFVCDKSAGQKLALEDLRSVRPGFGMPPKYLESIVGRELVRDVKFGDRVSPECFK